MGDGILNFEIGEGKESGKLDLSIAPRPTFRTSKNLLGLLLSRRHTFGTIPYLRGRRLPDLRLEQHDFASAQPGTQRMATCPLPFQMTPLGLR